MPIELLIEQFAQAADCCPTLDALTALVGDVTREIGFDFFAITFCDNLRQSAPRFSHFDNYPPVYAEVFVAQRLYRSDPILHAAQRRVGGFAWKRVGDILPLRSNQSDILNRAAREGLRDGYTIPANVPGEPCAAISFASRRAKLLTPERRWCTECIGRITLEATRQLRGLSALPSPVPHLNNREIQTLRRMAMGEIDKAIARALEISPETVRQYVKMARASYGAKTRTQLIVKALRDGQIPFDDESIPPSG